MGRRNLIPTAVLTVAALAAAWPGVAASVPPASQPATAPAAVGPIAYYVANCARCHGDISAAYVGLETPKKGHELEQVIDEMAVGPGNAPLDAEGLRQQTALHVAMFETRPFVWLDPADGATMTGEVLPGTTLQTEGGFPVLTKDYRFEVARSAGTLVATREGKTVRLPLKR